MSSTDAFEMRFTKQRIYLKTPVKSIQFFHEYAPTLYYYIRVKFARPLDRLFSIEIISFPNKMSVGSL